LWPLLERVPWASFHDRLSGPAMPRIPVRAPSQRLTDTELLALYEPQERVVELFDHGSLELLPPGRAYRYFDWPLTASTHHLIEGVMGGP
jgi:hypothetical protein